jgi:hypothetical protein
MSGAAELQALLTDWPMRPPRNWLAQVNKPISLKEVERVRTRLQRDRPPGSEAWVERINARLGLHHTIRREGRPRKDEEQHGLKN